MSGAGEFGGKHARLSTGCRGVEAIYAAPGAASRAVGCRVGRVIGDVLRSVDGGEGVVS